MQLNIVIPHTHTLLAVVKHFGTSENENIPVKGSDGQKYLHSFRSEPHSVTQWGRAEMGVENESMVEACITIYTQMIWSSLGFFSLYFQELWLSHFIIIESDGYF